MGRPSKSFLKIIACGSGSVDGNDLESSSENNGSNDKRGWSFRKKSARHRVLSNTVIFETPGDKGDPESASFNFQGQANCSTPEKTSTTKWTDENSHIPSSKDAKASERTAATVDDSKVGVVPDESVTVVIQAAIRSFLAQRVLLKHKNIIKLQAAVRGHLVRRHAVGSLRCVQAIVKMQALVRARRARMLVEGSNAEEKLEEKDGEHNLGSKVTQGKQNSGIPQPHVAGTSIEKLLSNKFARQLLESAPRTKPINLKCDPSQSDSAWKWLERWMSVSSTGIDQSQKLELSSERQEKEKVGLPDSHIQTKSSPEGHCELLELRSGIGEAAETFESEENLITYDADKFNFQAFKATSSSASHILETPQSENTSLNLRDNSLDTPPDQNKEFDLAKMKTDSLSGKTEVEVERPKHSIKRLAPEQHVTETKKFVTGSRKAINPTFIAAQSKFEELSSTANLTGSISSFNHDNGVESCLDTISSATDNTLNTRVIDLAEDSIPHSSRNKLGGSECGTELSISSTLDSPDRSEVEATHEQEVKVLLDISSNSEITKNLMIETPDDSSLQGTDVSYSIPVHSMEQIDIGDARGAPVSEVEQKLEKHASVVQIELEAETGQPLYKSSQQASPRSYTTVPESQGTPSQTSVKAKKIGSEKNGSKLKRRSLSAGKSTPNANHDSGTSSLEQLPKYHKPGKRRNSFGSAKTDQVDQEPRESSGSLPNYMQATESARAKALANSSPTLSPDLQEKDSYVKKRHSLPGANDRKGSPRIHRSMCQAQQGIKGNGNHPYEKKWQS